MREVSVDEYLDFISRNRSIVIEDQSISLEPIEVRIQEQHVLKLFFSVGIV